MSTFEDLRDALVLATGAVDALTSRLTEAKQVRDDADRRLTNWMLDNDVSSFKHHGASFYLSPKFHFKSTKANKGQIEQWLEERGQGLDDLQEVSFRRAPLKELLKTIFETEGPEALPSFLGVDTTPGVTIRGKSNLTSENDDNDEEAD